ncbi:hypothetical protein CesoFtcFv8_025751 [Champsocephalus esox]|nr:hypothetical protein CesoFtcFv8_025751 [Champsocephalus esox]
MAQRRKQNKCAVTERVSPAYSSCRASHCVLSPWTGLSAVWFIRLLLHRYGLGVQFELGLHQSRGRAIDYTPLTSQGLEDTSSPQTCVDTPAT